MNKESLEAAIFVLSFVCSTAHIYWNLCNVLLWVYGCHSGCFHADAYNCPGVGLSTILISIPKKAIILAMEMSPGHRAPLICLLKVIAITKAVYKFEKYTMDLNSFNRTNARKDDKGERKHPTDTAFTTEGWRLDFPRGGEMCWPALQ
jgi:hypothetical protein